MVLVVLHATKYPEFLPSGKEHSTGEDGQDNLVTSSASRRRRIADGAYQRLSPWRQVVHGLAIPCRRNVGNGQVRRHGEFALFGRETVGGDTSTGGLVAVTRPRLVETVEANHGLNDRLNTLDVVGSGGAE